MGPEDWELVENYSLMHLVEDTSFDFLAVQSANELDEYIKTQKVSSNSFSKLRRLLQKTTLPQKRSENALTKILSSEGIPDLREGKREIDEYHDTGKYLQEVFETHANENPETPYQLREGMTQIPEVANDLSRVITKLTSDLEDLSKTPEQNLKYISKLLLTFVDKSSRYHRGFKRGFAA